ncbi:hypothetical protein CFP56_002371 [Quercus suber]|uniref:Uncharacterized protein n=1 Tax=Quercus suber TaxID=58331 RepID=A0AAW0IKV4_QUESU
MVNNNDSDVVDVGGVGHHCGYTYHLLFLYYSCFFPFLFQNYDSENDSEDDSERPSIGAISDVALVDDVVQYKFGEKSSVSLLSSGFSDVTFKSYNGYVEKDSQQKL